MINQRATAVKNDLLIESWLEYSKHAASGGNLQQWKVEVSMLDLGLQFTLSVDEGIEPNLTDPIGAGALMSLGCLAETIKFTGEALGFNLCTVEVNSNSSFFDTSINMFFQRRGDKIELSKLDCVEKRRTLRGPYDQFKLNQSQIEEIDRRGSQDVQLLRLTSQRPLVKEFLSKTTAIRLTERSLFNELADEVFSRKNFPKRMIGLPIDTLGLKPLSEFALGFMLKHKIYPRYRWAVASSLKESVDVPIEKCSEIYYIQGSDDSSESWIDVGRALTGVWLFLSGERLALQPFANNLMIYNLRQRPDLYLFRDKNLKLLDEMESELKDQIGIDANLPGIMFRVGKAARTANPSPRIALAGGVKQGV